MVVLGGWAVSYERDTPVLQPAGPPRVQEVIRFSRWFDLDQIKKAALVQETPTNAVSAFKNGYVLGTGFRPLNVNKLWY